MIDVFDRAGGPVLAVERVPMESVSSYGVIAGEPAPDSARASTASTTSSRSRRANEAPSDLAIIGRYILTPDIFAALTRPARTSQARFSSPTACATC